MEIIVEVTLLAHLVKRVPCRTWSRIRPGVYRLRNGSEPRSIVKLFTVTTERERMTAGVGSAQNSETAVLRSLLSARAIASRFTATTERVIGVALLVRVR